MGMAMATRLGPQTRAARYELIAGPFVGELGYEVGRWLPCVRRAVALREWDAVTVYCQAGHEPLYAWLEGAECVPFVFDYATSQQEGTGFVAKRAAPALAQYQAAADAIAEQAADRVRRGVAVTHLTVPRTAAVEPQNEPDPAPLHIAAGPEAVERWARRLPPDPVIIGYRGYQRGPSKNTRADILNAMPGLLDERGYNSVVVGLTELPIPAVPGALNLINRTQLGDLVALLSLARCAVGASSGTMHVASAVGVPHVTWGGDNWGPRTQARYETEWNPNGTPVRFLETPGYGWEIEPERAADAVTAIARAATGRKPVHHVVDPMDAWEQVNRRVDALEARLKGPPAN